MSEKIIHDAEYYVVEVQNREKWAAEDADLDVRLAELKANACDSPDRLPLSMQTHRRTEVLDTVQSPGGRKHGPGALSTLRASVPKERGELTRPVSQV